MPSSRSSVMAFACAPAGRCGQMASGSGAWNVSCAWARALPVRLRVRTDGSTRSQIRNSPMQVPSCILQAQTRHARARHHVRHGTAHAPTARPAGFKASIRFRGRAKPQPRRTTARRRPVHSNQSCHPRRPSHRGRRSKERRNERVRALFESLVTVLCWRVRTVQSRQNAFLPAPSSPRCERAHPAVSEVPVDALWLSPPCSSLRVVVGTKRARARAAQAP